MWHIRNRTMEAGAKGEVIIRLYYARNGNTILSSLESTAAIFDGFATCSITDVQKTIMEEPSKSCSLDPIPTNAKDF